MLSYGKQHKKVKGIKSSRLYIHPYVSRRGSRINATSAENASFLGSRGTFPQ